MTDAEYALYREVRDQSDRLPSSTATAYLQQAAERNGDSEVVLAVLAMHAFDRGQTELAVQVCASLLGKRRTAWSVAAEAYRQSVLGTMDNADSLATEAIGIDPANPCATSIAAGLAARRGTVDEARHLAFEAYSSDHANPEAYGRVFKSATLVFDWEAAKELLAEAPAEFIGTPAYFSAVATIARIEERNEDAVEALRIATELNPYRPMPWVQLGVALRRLKRFPEAHVAVAKALELSPKNAAALTLAARLAEAKRDFAKRDLLLLEAASHSAAIKPFSHGHAAQRFLNSGMPAEALRALEIMEREGGFGAKQAAKLGKLGPLADLERWTELERTLAELDGSQLSPSVKLLASARLAAHHGDVRGAIAQLEGAFAAKPTDGRLLRWLLIFAGEIADIKCLDRVSKLGSEHLTDSAERAFSFVSALYSAKALDQADRILAEALARFPQSPKLLAAEAWRLERIGDGPALRAVRMRLPTKWKTWQPPKTLRPPKYTYWYGLGRQLRRRFLGY